MRRYMGTPLWKSSLTEEACKWREFGGGNPSLMMCRVTVAPANGVFMERDLKFCGKKPGGLQKETCTNDVHRNGNPSSIIGLIYERGVFAERDLKHCGKRPAAMTWRDTAGLALYTAHLRKTVYGSVDWHVAKDYTDYSYEYHDSFLCVS